MDIMEIIYSIFIFLFTTCIGSFLNVVIYRLPRKMSLAKPSSHCPNCNKKIKWYDNIPIISFLALGGKCRNCKCKISPRYVIVEALTGIISTLIFIRFGLSFNALFGILFFLILIPISFIDIEHLIIMDRFIIILLVLGVFGLFFNNLNYGNGTINVDLFSKLIGAGGALIFALIIILLELLLKREIIGGGDLKLIFAAGLLLGWQLLLLGMFISSFIASIVEIIFRIIKSKKANDEEFNVIEEKSDEEKEIAEYKEKGMFPFGPYLALGFMIAFLFGINMLEWWFSIFVL